MEGEEFASKYVKVVPNWIEIEYRFMKYAENTMTILTLKEDVVLFCGDTGICMAGFKHDNQSGRVVYPVEDYETLKERLK